MRLNLLLLLVLLACGASRSSMAGKTLPAPPTSAPVAPTSFPVSGPFGTGQRFVLAEVSPDGQWLIGCQAREDTDGDGEISGNRPDYAYSGRYNGDRSVAYLFLDPGPGQPIDDFIGTDPTGRYLAVIRNSALWLIDARTRTESELARFQEHFQARFSPDGRHLLFLREQQGKTAAILRELSSGREQRLDAGAGELRTVWFSLSGEWVHFGVLVEDTNKDGVLRWSPWSSSPTCKEIFTDSRAHWRDDSLVRRARRLEGGPLHELGSDSGGEWERLALPMGQSILRRGPQGELYLEDDSGRRTEWVPASCKGRVLYADIKRQLVVVACASAGKEALAPVELHGASIHQPLGLSVRPPFMDLSLQRDTPPPRLLTLIGARPKDASLSGRESGQTFTPGPFLLDLDKHALHPVTGKVVGTRGPLALLAVELPRAHPRKSRTLLTLLNVETGARTELPETRGNEVRWAGALILYLGVLVDLETGRVLGELSEPDRPVLALDPTGRVLRGSPGPAANSIGSDDWGPVSWEPVQR